MGVPAFFRWLSRVYPKVIIPAAPRSGEPSRRRDQEESDDDIIPLPDIDCLYLDMNALIHPCSHPTSDVDIPPPANEDEMHQNVGEYIDLIMEIIAPQKLVYLAIDGVAPRAKLNQQRGRRFRSALEIDNSRQRKSKLAQLWEKEGIEIPQDIVQATSWDHNVITPGTPFMKRISGYLRNYVVNKLLTDPRWANLTVIFSDANTPGEGEHKILDFIRRQRTQPDYDPNTK